jgi:hypothetical protein
MANKITGAKAGWPRQLAMRSRWAARFAQFRRSTTVKNKQNREKGKAL